MTWQSLIVPTRFLAPRGQPSSVVRARLLTQLDSLRLRKVLLVGATAGFGKTTLMAQWAERLVQEGNDVAWVTLGEGEGDLQTFFSYLVQSLKSAGVDLSQPLPAPMPNAEVGKVRDTVGVLVNELAEHPRSITLIVDDVHYLTDPRAHAALRDLLEQSTDNFHVALAGRFLPAIPLSRLRVAEQVGELTSEELAFDDAEMRQFFAGSDFGLSATHLQQAREVFGGWPAGMQLLSLAGNRARRWDSVVDLLQTGEGFREYVRENVLVNLAPDQVAFLERISLLPRFSPSLAMAVSGFEDAESRIRELERMHLFISRFASDGRDTWYRLHPLFANSVKPAHENRAGEIGKYHERAARWFASNGYLLEAVGHARQSGGLISPSDVLGEAPMSVRSLSQLGSMRRLMQEIDPASLHPDSKLLPLAAWAFLLTAQLHQARRWLDQIDPSRSEEFALQRQVIDGGTCLYEDDTGAVEDRVGHLDPFSVKQPFVRQCLATEIITAHQAAGRFDEADRSITEFIHRYRDEHDEMALIVHALAPAGLLSRGSAIGAEERGARVLRTAEEAAGPNSVSAAVAASFLADAQYELNRPEEARATLGRRWHMLYYSPPDPLVRAVLTQSRIASLLGGPSAATKILADALPRFQVRGSDRALAMLLHEQVRIDLLAHTLDATDARLRTLRELAHRNSGARGFLGEVSYFFDLAHARVAIARSDPTLALRHLAQARDQSLRLRRTRIQAKVQLLTAQASAMLHKSNDSLAAAQRAIDLCEPGGLRRTILDQGHAVITLCLDHRDQLRMSDDLVEALSAELERSRTESRGGTSTSPSAALGGERLTPREMEIAQLLAQSMSNKRIASALGISPATVKWNLQNIFLKLGVNTRYDVIVWLRGDRAPR